MIEADLAFHRAIYEAAGNPVLVQSAERHWSHIRRIMGATLSQRLVRVIIPAAIPTVLSGLRVGGALVIVGVVVSEMLIS